MISKIITLHPAKKKLSFSAIFLFYKPKNLKKDMIIYKLIQHFS